MHPSDLKKEVEHPYLTKREMCSRDELDCSHFHHNGLLKCNHQNKQTNKQTLPDKILPKYTMMFWKKEVEHPFLTKREMCSRDELDSSRFHHNAPTGSLPNRPTTIVLSIFFFC